MKLDELESLEKQMTEEEAYRMSKNLGFRFEKMPFEGIEVEE